MLRGHLLCIDSLITSLELAQEMFLGWKHLAKSVLRQLSLHHVLIGSFGVFWSPAVIMPDSECGMGYL